MLQIPLIGKRGSGLFATVSPEDYEDLAQFRWNLLGGYAARNWFERFPDGGFTRHTETMHRRIMGAKYDDGRLVDHINGNKLDNRRENLRFVSASENALNVPSRAASGHKGVYLVKFRTGYTTKSGEKRRYPWQGYRVEVRSGRVSYRSGPFSTLEKALLARRALRQKHGLPDPDD